MSFLEVGVRAARAGGAIIAAARKERAFNVTVKSPSDFVTEIDVASERAIVEVLRGAYPEHDILGEEGVTAATSSSEYRWVIDPLDGTTNFIHDLPFFAVSIALENGGRPIVGVVLDVPHDELYTASLGDGAFCDGKPLSVSPTETFEDGLWLTGVPFRNVEVMPRFLPGLEKMATGSCGIRRMGSAALDLCCVASGKAEGFWEYGLARWDIAAGVLLVTEAGGRVTGFADDEGFLDTGDLVASNARLHDAMLTRLN